ncbi:GNAT family N-acetyltransferase [Thalassotalea atypica]|uniref:GNAT family N-acetyltransferase n=1 Tax=Thalassotalea atypica TaxID=2054316 RepID=UPI0025727F0F|nr:GNAT family N-acetyltransferase [Thalassotalea atypica]
MNIKFTLAPKHNKASIKRFYRQQNYNARFKGLDYCFIATIDDDIIGCLIISQLIPHNHQLLLHGLVTHNQQQGLGVASQLLEFSVFYMKKTNSESTSELFCFADESLSDFYSKSGFSMVDACLLNEELGHRYSAYKKYNKALVIFKIIT